MKITRLVAMKLHAAFLASTLACVIGGCGSTPAAVVKSGYHYAVLPVTLDQAAQTEGVYEVVWPNTGEIRRVVSRKITGDCAGTAHDWVIMLYIPPPAVAAPPALTLPDVPGAPVTPES
jgi:hypothetical protein